MTAPAVLGLDFGGTKIAAAVCDAVGTRLGSATIDTLAEDGAPGQPGTRHRGRPRLLAAAAPGRTLVAVGASTSASPPTTASRSPRRSPAGATSPLGRELARAFAGARDPAGDRREGRRAGRAASGVRWPAATPASTSTSAPGWRSRSSPTARCSSAGTARPGRSATTCASAAGRRTGAGGARPARGPVVSGKALLGRPGDPAGPGPGRAAAVFAGATGDAGRIAGLLAEFVHELALHVVNLAIAVDPARIVVGGGMVRSWAYLEAGLRAGTRRRCPVPAGAGAGALPVRRAVDGRTRARRRPRLARCSARRHAGPQLDEGTVRDEAHRMIAARRRMSASLFAAGLQRVDDEPTDLHRQRHRYRGQGGEQHRQGHAQAGRHASRSRTSQGQTWTCQFNPFNPAVNSVSLGFVYEPLVFVNLLQDQKETPMLASSYQWAPDKKSIVFTIRDGVKWSDGQPFSAEDVAYTFDIMKQVPGDRPLLAVDRRRAEERHRRRQQGHDDVRPGRPEPYFFNFANQVGIVPKHIFVHRRGGGAPGHLGRPEAGRHRTVHGGPVLARTTSSTSPTAPTGSRASRTSRRSQYPAYLDNGPANLDLASGKAQWGSQFIPNIKALLPEQVHGQPHLVAAGHERRDRPEPRPVPPGDQQAGGAAGDRARDRPAADLADR